MTDRAQEVQDFKNRVFSGMDLLQIMEREGIGVGATMHLVQDCERLSDQHGHRKFDYADSVDVALGKTAIRVMHMLFDTPCAFDDNEGGYAVSALEGDIETKFPGFLARVHEASA